jgi:hypothetical protein
MGRNPWAHRQVHPFAAANSDSDFASCAHMHECRWKRRRKHLEWSVSKLSRIERAKQMVDVHGVRAMLDLYGLTCDQWEPIVDLAREARQKGWWRAYGIPDRGYVELETAASSVRDFQLAHVPGLLQTADYARALFRVSQLRRTEDQIERLIAARMVRQQRLTDDDPLELCAIVDEAVLRRPVGSTEIMRAQLRHMVECAELPHVTLQTLPISAGAHLGMDGAFIILSFSDAAEPDAVYIEHPSGALHIQDGAVSIHGAGRAGPLRGVG